MVTATLSVIALLALIVWRIVFAGMHHLPLIRAIARPRQRRNNALGDSLHILDPGPVAVIAGNRFEDSSDGLDRLDPEDRAKASLRRVVALTGATQMGDGYVLDVGATRFHVRNGYIRRLRDAADPKCGYEETCFYPIHNGMPKAEEIATALLQLANNPALFYKWALKNGQAVKADGQLFSRAE